MTGRATDKTEGEAAKNSRSRVAIIILAVPVLAALFIIGIILLIFVAVMAFWLILNILALFFMTPP